MSGLNQTVCRYFSTSGHCFYGEQCNFVHTREHPPPGTGAGTGAGTGGPPAGAGGEFAKGPVIVPKNQRPCRNITLHGFCKFEGKGCDFNHNLTQEETGSKKTEMETAFYPSSPPIPSSTPTTTPPPPPTTTPNPNGRPTTAHLPSLRAPHSTGSIPQKTESKKMTISASPEEVGSFIPPATDATKPLPKGDRRLANATDFIPPPPSSSLPVSFNPQEAQRVEDPAAGGPDFNPIPDYHNAFPPLKSTSTSLRPGAGMSSHLGPVSSFPEFDPTAQTPPTQGPPLSHPSRLSSAPDLGGAGGYATAGAFPEFDPTAIKSPFTPTPMMDPSAKKMRPQSGPFPEYDPIRNAPVLPTSAPSSSSSPGPSQVPSSQRPKGTYPSYYFSGGPPPLPYPGALPHTSPMINKESRRSIQSFFMPENIRGDFRRHNRAIREQVSPDDPLAKELPQNSPRFHTFCPLETLEQKRAQAKVFSYSSFMYKCISSVDGHPYAVRRIDGLRIVHEAAMQIIDIWRGIQHPNIVTLRELYSGKDPNGCSAVFFVYDYHPCSETLEGKITQPSYFAENVLWSFVSQILSALRAIHTSGRACRIIHPSKIIITGKNRLRISGVGIFDIIHYDGGKNLMQHQHEDLFALGKLILCLACKSMSAMQNLQKSLEFVASHYSSDLKNLLVDLFSKPIRVPHSMMDEVFSKYAFRFFREIELLHNYTDLLETELTKEVENGRLFRMITKLGFINERPEFDMDPSWSETDNRYLLKLLRDYIFHQTHSDGSPSVDVAHVVDSLNKLDAGSDEKVTLMSRDEQAVLIVSYKDLHNCVQSAFAELYSSSIEGVDRSIGKSLTPQPHMS